MPFYEKKTDGILLRVYVQPRSSKNALIGIHGESLKIKLTAPPVEGAANAMCLAFLSKLLNVPKSHLNIVSGKTGRHKKVMIRIPNGDVAAQEEIRISKYFESIFKKR
jgi:uncharacterized protein (TIGR00251 family)